MKFKKGDEVIILSGKDRNKIGKVELVFPKTNQIVVSGVNKVKKHTKATRKGERGGIVEANMPINASKAALICPNCHKMTRIGYKVLGTKTKGNKKLRICVHCKESVEKI
jgi:large subunit ribosomal protein L24